MMPLARLAMLAAVLASAAASAQERELRFQGYAYDLATGRFLYTEVHDQRVSGEQWRGGTIDYYAPNGAKIGHKVLDFTHDPYVPLYRMTLHTSRGTYVEGITAVGPDRIEMSKQGYGDTGPSETSVKHRNPIAAD